MEKKQRKRHIDARCFEKAAGWEAVKLRETFCPEPLMSYSKKAFLLDDGGGADDSSSNGGEVMEGCWR